MKWLKRSLKVTNSGGVRLAIAYITSYSCFVLAMSTYVIRRSYCIKSVTNGPTDGQTNLRQHVLRLSITPHGKKESFIADKQTCSRVIYSIFTARAMLALQAMY